MGLCLKFQLWGSPFSVPACKTRIIDDDYSFTKTTSRSHFFSTTINSRGRMA